jgi:NADH-quinone oxidoreductase subunit M
VVSARLLALWAFCWLSLAPSLAGAVPLTAGPRGAGVIAVREPASGVVELAPAAGGYEATVLLENRGRAEIELRTQARGAAREPVAPVGLTLTFSPGGASSRVAPGQQRPLKVRWVPQANGPVELDAALVVEAAGVDSVALALRAEAPRGPSDLGGWLGRHALSLLTLLPFFGMALVGLWRSVNRSNDFGLRLIAYATLALEAALFAWLLAHLDRAFHVAGGNDGYQFRERWALWAGGGLELSWGLDGASYGPLVSAAAVATAGLFALRAVELRVASVYAGLLGALGAAFGVASATDLALLTLSWSALLASIALLVGRAGGAPRLLAVGALGALLLAAGAVSVSAQAGPSLLSNGALAARSFALPSLGLPDPAAAGPAPTPWALAAWAAALLPAAAFVPFQGWLLRVVSVAPSGAAAIAAGVVPSVSLYALLRVASPFAALLSPRATGALAAAGALLTLASFAFVFYETDLRRAFTRLALAPLPLALLGVSGQTPQGSAGAFALAAGQGVIIAALVLVGGVLAERVGHARRDLLVGVAEHMPRFALLAGLLSLASSGGPGAWSFWAALLVFWGAWGSSPLWVCVGVLALALGASAAWLLARNLLLGRAPRRLVHDPRLEPYGGHPPDLSRREWLICAPLAALVLALGCFPRLLLGPLEGVAADLPTPPPARDDSKAPPADGARTFRTVPPPGRVPSP